MESNEGADASTSQDEVCMSSAVVRPSLQLALHTVLQYGYTSKDERSGVDAIICHAGPLQSSSGKSSSVKPSKC